MSMRISKLAPALLLALLALPALAAVDDAADILDASAEARIARLIRDHQAAGGGPVLVRTEKRRAQGVTIPGAMPQDYVQALGEAEGILTQGRGFVYVVNTTEMWIQTGRGSALQGPDIEPAIQAAMDQTVIPHYRDGRMNEGTIEGMARIFAAMPPRLPPVETYYPILAAFGMLAAGALLMLLRQTGRTWTSPDSVPGEDRH